MASRSSLSPLLLLATVSACGGATAPGDAVRFDPCSPLNLTVDADVTADQMSGLGAAIALWNQSAHSRLSLSVQPAPSGAPTLPVRFQAAAALSHGFYDGRAGAVFINTDLQGTARAIVVAHEVGHAFGLVHVSPDQRPSVMNPGNLDTAPTIDDLHALASIWGQCSSAP